MPRTTVKTEPIVIERESEFMRIRIEIEPHRDRWAGELSGDELNAASARVKIAEPLRRRLTEAHRAAWRELWSHVIEESKGTPDRFTSPGPGDWGWTDPDPENTRTAPNPKYRKPETR